MNDGIFRPKRKPKRSPITIWYRDGDLKRHEIKFNYHYEVGEWVRTYNITDDYYDILMVASGSLVLYSALADPHSLFISELISFFE